MSTAHSRLGLISMNHAATIPPVGCPRWYSTPVNSGSIAGQSSITWIGVVGPERALVPQAELERREVLRIVACAMGAIEKVVAALNKQTLHPPEKVHAPWVEHN